jgi:APA family basic amino acid/polyamine antiporter
MIGTGVFTTTGLLVRDVGSPPAILVGWLMGGVLALCGALSYAELAASVSQNGGEYRFLTHIYHPAVGFVAGWISLIVGFSAPIAASALAFGTYLNALVPAVSPRVAAAALVVLASVAHGLHVRAGSGVQNVFAVAKVVLVAGLIAGGLALGDPEPGWEGPMASKLASPELAVGLIFISFAYSGWNGAAYIAGEVRRPARSLPIALGVGTALVTVLYVALNAVFLSVVPAAQMSGRVDVAHVAAVHIFGSGLGRVLSGLVALALVSSVGAMIMVGPRVYEAMGEDHPRLSFLRARTSAGGPVAAVALQGALALAMLLTSSFGALLTYIGFTLSLSSGLAVAGVYVLRVREPRRERPYRVWGYPVTPALFLLLAGWMVVHALAVRPVESLAGVATIVVGLLLYAVVRRGRPPGGRPAGN